MHGQPRWEPRKDPLTGPEDAEATGDLPDKPGVSFVKVAPRETQVGKVVMGTQPLKKISATHLFS